MFLGKNWKIFNFILRLSRLSHDCFAIKSFLWKLQCVSRLISRLSNPWKTHVFSFYVVDVTVFQTLSFSLALLLSNPLQPKINFHSNLIIFKQKTLQNHFKLCFPFCLDYAVFSLGFWNLGIFKKGVGVLIFCENFFKTLIRLNPICWVCICVGLMRHFDHVLRQISSCSCIFHRCCVLLHVRCLTECPSDILVLIWTQMSSFAWVYSCLPMFWSMNMYSTHFVQVVPQCHAMHTLDIL